MQFQPFVDSTSGASINPNPGRVDPPVQGKDPVSPLTQIFRGVLSGQQAATLDPADKGVTGKKKKFSFEIEDEKPQRPWKRQRTDDPISAKDTGIDPAEDLERLLQLPSNLSLGTAVDDGDCFFDALAKALNSRLGREFHSIQSLRKKCFDYFTKNYDKAAILIKADQSDPAKYNLVQFSAQDLFTQAPIWGRSNVEAVMLCKILTLPGIHFVELLIDPVSQKYVPAHFLATHEGLKPIVSSEVQLGMYPTLVAKQDKLHFIPIIQGEKKQIEEKKDLPLSTIKPAAITPTLILEDSKPQDEDYFELFLRGVETGNFVITGKLLDEVNIDEISETLLGIEVKRISFLNLLDVPIGSRLKIVGTLLEFCSDSTEFDLSNNNLKGEHLEAICQSLLLSSVNTLDLRGNKFVSSKGVIRFCGILNNTKLQQLKVGNSFSGNTFDLLLQSIKGSQIKILDLSGNNALKDNFYNFKEFLKKKTISEINIENTGLNPDKIKQLISLIPHTSLVQCHINENKLSLELKQALLDALEGNRRKLADPMRLDEDKIIMPADIPSLTGFRNRHRRLHYYIYNLNLDAIPAILKSIKSKLWNQLETPEIGQSPVRVTIIEPTRAPR